MPKLKRVITCDIDSTLADTRTRAAAMIDKNDREATDWVAYAKACHTDTPTDVVSLLRAFVSHYRIVLVTARPPEAYDETMTWLRMHRVPFDNIHMRPAKSSQSSTRWKVSTIAAIDAEEGVALHLDDWWEVGDRVRSELQIPTVIVRVYAPTALEPAF